MHTNNLVHPKLNQLKNHIDLTKVPFSDRGSRLLIYQNNNQSRLFIKLAERLTNLDSDIEAYLTRSPFINNLEFVDHNGEILEFQITTNPHVLIFKTRLGSIKLVFHDKHTLAFGLPDDKTIGIRFHVLPQQWKVTHKGGEFRSIRNLAYFSNTKTIQNRIIPETGGYTVEYIVKSDIESTVLVVIDDDLSKQPEIMPFSIIYSNAKKRWQDWFRKVPKVQERFVQTYAYAWWVMASNLVQPKGAVAYEAMMPSKNSYVGLWLWDSAMHALAYRHVDPELARNQIRAMLACKLPDGMLPDAVYDEGVISEIDHPIVAEVTKPPILAWAALKLHETDPNIDFLREIYVPLVRWNAWWFSMNDDNANGLAQYNHPYSSGLDDNPLWDYGMPVESPDLNTYLCVQMGSLAMIAEFLGMNQEGAMWRRKSSALVRRMIQEFWDEEKGLFNAIYNMQPIAVTTPFNLFPLWTGQLPEINQNRLIEHLTNPNKFWGSYAIPTVARDDPHFDPETMWRGPIWANINYFFIEALRQINLNDLADQLTDNTLNLLMKFPGIYEYYNANTGEPPAKAAEIFGWTAAVFIDLAIYISRRETV